ncbi:CU044_2847 family protein [Streptomyces sp. NPDC003691]
MRREVSRFRLANGGAVHMEVDAADSVDHTFRGPGGEYEARAPFGHTMEAIGQAVSEAVGSLVHVPGPRPSELTIEFNVRLNAEAGAVIVGNADDGHFRITAVWAPDRRGDARI